MRQLGVSLLCPEWETTPSAALTGFPPHSLVPIYTPGWRLTFAQEHNTMTWQVLKPGLFKLESSALTNGPVRLHLSLIAPLS